MARVRNSVKDLEDAAQSGISDEIYRAIISEGISLLKVSHETKDRIATLGLILKSQQILDKKPITSDDIDDFDISIDEKIRAAAQAANEYVEYNFEDDEEDE